MLTHTAKCAKERRQPHIAVQRPAHMQSHMQSYMQYQMQWHKQSHVQSHAQSHMQFHVLKPVSRGGIRSKQEQENRTHRRSICRAPC